MRIQDIAIDDALLRLIAQSRSANLMKQTPNTNQTHRSDPVEIAPHSQIAADALAIESKQLQKAWMRHDLRRLDSYLTADVEDPRINVQSIITRAFLIDSIWPKEFTGLIRQEFLFGACMTFILKTLKSTPSISHQELLDALAEGSQSCGDAKIPPYLQQTYDTLSANGQDIPDYITGTLIDLPVDQEGLIAEPALSTFENLWNIVLHDRNAKSISVMEPACGSANDYRFIHSYGVSRFLGYTGFDICKKNIINAQRRFPSVNFVVDDILNLSSRNEPHDFLYAHDLFEHLSLDALDVAIAEVSRLTRKQACLSFFSMDDIDRHIVKPRGYYHCNTLSLTQVKNKLMKYAADIDVVHIDTFLKQNYRCDDYHNKNAYTLIVSFDKNC